MGKSKLGAMREQERATMSKADRLKAQKKELAASKKSEKASKDSE